jgi:hypothetical protein
MNQLRALLVGSVVSSLVLVGQQASGQEKQSRSQKSQMKSMENMPSDGMMKDCMEHHQASMKSIDEMNKIMDGAKQSNDIVKMKSAIDQAQKQLTEMKQHMTKCGDMMSMMHKMHGMGGMMKDSHK